MFFHSQRKAAHHSAVEWIPPSWQACVRPKRCLTRVFSRRSGSIADRKARRRERLLVFSASCQPGRGGICSFLATLSPPPTRTAPHRMHARTQYMALRAHAHRERHTHTNLTRWRKAQEEFDAEKKRLMAARQAQRPAAERRGSTEAGLAVVSPPPLREDDQEGLVSGVADHMPATVYATKEAGEGHPKRRNAKKVIVCAESLDRQDCSKSKARTPCKCCRCPTTSVLTGQRVCAPPVGRCVQEHLEPIC